MSNRIFLDSSLPIEYRKGNQILLFEKIEDLQVPNNDDFPF